MYRSPKSTDAALAELQKLLRTERKNNLHEGFLFQYLIEEGMKPEDIAGKLSISRRLVYQRIKVYQAYAGGKITDTFLSEVGFKKAYYVIKSIDRGHDIQKYLTVASIAAMADDALRKLLNKDYVPTPKTTTLYLTEAQSALMHHYLSQYGAIIDGVTPGRRRRLLHKEFALFQLFEAAVSAGILKS